jgi:hypothetical protein
MLPMLLLWPGLCYLYAALCLLLWPELCGSTMVSTMRLPMLASMIQLWATIRGKSFPVTNSLPAACVAYVSLLGDLLTNIVETLAAQRCACVPVTVVPCQE